jgi:sigma-B regulation protein RsbU (phosphoserine phosphatase)
MTDAHRQLTVFLRGDITGFALSLLVLFIGLAALSVHLLRLKSKDRSLLWFGLFITLYGLRSVSRHAIPRVLFEAPPAFWLYFDGIVSDVIVIPALVFFEAFYGRGWKSSLRWLLRAVALWAVVAIVVNAVSGQPANVPDPSTLLIVALPLILLAGLAFGYRPPQSSMAGIIFAGFTIFLLTVILDHLSRARLVPWAVPTEPVGFLINLGCLGYVAVQRFVGNEQQLVAIAEEMKSASRIQASILPRGVPNVPGLQIAVRYIPMTAVAGDFYDFLAAGPGSVGILVADVTGHGVPAALVASMVKVTVSSQAGNAADPAPVIAALNQMICRQAQGQFTTAGYLYVDAESRGALYAAAGHPPLLLWRKANRTLREFRENGLLMGVRPAEHYANIPIDLQPGDRFVLYTDGIPEASNSAAEFFGEDRLKAFIEDGESLTADAFADALLARLAQWSGSSSGAQTDDITLVVVDVL